MAKQFAGFTPQQTAVLLQKMGYTGSSDSKAMQQFIASNPAAAARLGKYTETAQRMIAGQPAAKVKPPAAAMGMAEGGYVVNYNNQFPGFETYEVMGPKGISGSYKSQADAQAAADKLNAGSNTGLTATNTGLTANTTSPLTATSPMSAATTGSTQPAGSLGQLPDTIAQPNPDPFAAVTNATTTAATGAPVATTTQYSPAGTAAQTAWEEYKSFKGEPGDMFGVKKFAGRTFTDPATGTTYTSDGSKWIVSDAGANKYLLPDGTTSYINPDFQQPPEGSQDISTIGATGPTTGIIDVGRDIPTPPPAGASSTEIKKYEKALQDYREKAAIAASQMQADPNALANLRSQLNTATLQRNNYLLQIQSLPANDPRRTTLSNLIAEADKNISALQQQVSTIGGSAMRTQQQELMSKAATSPQDLVTTAAPATVSEAATQAGMVAAGTGALGAAPSVTPTTVTAAEQAAAPTAAQAKPFEAVSAAPAIEGAMSTPAVGAVSEGARVQAATAAPTSLAQLSLNAAQIEKAREVAAIPDMTVSQDQLVTAAKASVIPAADAAISAYQSTLEAAQGAVKPQELVDAAGILNGAKAVEAIAVTMEGLNSAAVALAAQGEFTPEALAVAAQGTVSAMSTVQGQLSALMQSFNNGTPAWAAGAMRSANAAMAARGLGGSSMAAAAIVQAAMESATPIAAADAKVFADMELTNLNNRQQVALANAAAQAQLELSNLNNRQQAMLQNSANSFALQSQNLSNQQQVVLANAQFKAALQEQSLNINTQAALANAARYAEVANINLSNQQQTALQRSAENLQVEMANLSNRQQTAIANAQIEAAIRGQELSNEQQARVVNAARIGEIANLNFTAKQQRALENARLAQTVDIENLSAKNAKLLADAAAMSQLELTNLSNKQQAAVQNAQAFLQMDLQNLNNQQQSLMFNSQARVQALLTDAAAQNAAKQFNASSEMQVEQFNNSLNAQISQFNTAQLNALNQFNAGETNAAAKFNAEIKNARDVFEAQNAVVIAQSNAQWRQNITTLETQQKHQANMVAAQAATQMTQSSLETLWQRERDLMQYAFTAAENSEARATEILIAKMDNDATAQLQSSKQKADNVVAIFNALAQL